MKILVQAGPLLYHVSSRSQRVVLFEIGVKGEDHWLLLKAVSKVCDWPRGRADVPPYSGTAGPGPVLDDADRLVIKAICLNWYNNVVIVVSARLDEVERMVNNLVEILEKWHQLEVAQN